MNPIKIYTCQRMNGRFMDEMRSEADMLVRTLGNYGFIALNPVIEEQVPYIHDLLAVGNPETLHKYWRRDKGMIREADILLDYNTEGKSDGTNNEVAYARYCLWKPVVRVWSGPGGAISRIEDDIVVPSLYDALRFIKQQWGTYEQLGAWREAMWRGSFNRWMDRQKELRQRYGMDTKIVVEG